MRILHWMPHYHPDTGGVETLARHLLPALARRGHEQAVVVAHGEHALPDRMEVDGIPILRCHLARFTETKNIVELLKMRGQLSAFYREFQPTLDHVHYSGVVTFLYSLAKVARPMLLTLHSVVKDMPHGPETITQRLLSEARWVTGVSQATLNEAIAWWPPIADHCSVVMNGLVPPLIAPSAWPSGVPHLVAVGRLVPEKGFDAAIDLLGLLPDVRLTIAGDGPVRAALEERARPYGDRVRFTGWVAQADLPALLATASVVVVPSRWQEPFCLVALEAAFAARPVVATIAGGLPEVVANGETGWLVPMDDVAAMADRVRRVIDDPIAAAAMGLHARQRALTRFALERCADEYDALYRAVLPD